ncbi:MAG TPA: hypothetical protein VJJ78_02955 [Candidatus Saccharimonadales bacterium]|nr:hypothetical protein [Candidatus Saccharimonadales bacterium]
MNTPSVRGVQEAVIGVAGNALVDARDSYVSIRGAMSNCSGLETVVVLAGAVALFSRFTQVRAGEVISTSLDLVSDGAVAIGRRAESAMRQIGNLVLPTQ